VEQEYKNYYPQLTIYTLRNLLFVMKSYAKPETNP